MLRRAVRARKLTPAQAEDALFLFRKFEGRRSLEHILVARGYLSLAETRALQRAPSRLGSVVPRPPSDPDALASGRLTEGTWVAPRPTFAESSLDSGDEDEGAATLHDEALPQDLSARLRSAMGDEGSAGRTLLGPASIPLVTEAPPPEDASPWEDMAERTAISELPAALGRPSVEPAPSRVEPRQVPSRTEPAPSRIEPALVDRTPSGPPEREASFRSEPEPLRAASRETEAHAAPPVTPVPLAAADADETTLPPGAFELLPDASGAVGGYRIEGLIATGRRAVVYRAVDLAKKRAVALRVFRGDVEDIDAMLERVGPRLLIGAALNHPSVIRTFDLGRAGERPFLALELVPGLTLEDRVETEGPMELLAALEMGRDLARGLAAIHGRGELHGDLRPDRVLLGLTGAKLAGFGIPPPSGAEVEGLPALPSPERAWGRAEGPASELYALGGLLYLALVGHLPFDPADARAYTAALDRPASDLDADRPDLPPEIAELVDSLLAPSPESRPRSAGEVAERLARAAARTEGEQGGAISSALRPSWSFVWGATGAGIGALGFASALLGVLWPSARVGLAPIAWSAALGFAVVLELMRLGQVPLTFSTPWLVRARDGCGWLAGAACVAGLVGSAPGLDVLLAGLGAVGAAAWCLGTALRIAVARARSDRGRGRALAVLGDRRLVRWRAWALPLTAALAVMTGIRWLLEVYFATET